MSDYWLIRIQNGSAYVWKRKYFLGLIAVPWKYHGGTDVVFTPDTCKDVLEAAFKHIAFQTPKANITVEME